MIEERGPMNATIMKLIDCLSRANDGMHDQSYQERQLQLAGKYFHELSELIRTEGLEYRKVIELQSVLSDQVHNEEESR